MRWLGGALARRTLPPDSHELWHAHRTRAERVKLKLATDLDSNRFKRYCSRLDPPVEEAGLNS